MASFCHQKLIRQLFLGIVLSLETTGIMACQESLVAPGSGPSVENSSLSSTSAKGLEIADEYYSRLTDKVEQFQKLANLDVAYPLITDDLKRSFDNTWIQMAMASGNDNAWPNLTRLYAQGVKPLAQYLQGQTTALNEDLDFALRIFTSHAHDQFLIKLLQQLDSLGLWVRDVSLTADPRDLRLVFPPQDGAIVAAAQQDAAQPITNVYITRSLATSWGRAITGLQILPWDKDPATPQTFAGLEKDSIWHGLQQILLTVRDFNKRTDKQVSVVCIDLDLIAMENQQNIATRQKVEVNNFGEQHIVFLPIDFINNPAPALQQIKTQLQRLEE